MKSICTILIINFILLTTVISLTAQSNIPILKQQLRASTADSCQLLYELGKEYESVNLDSCFYLLTKALDIAKRQNNPFAIAQTMHRIGYTYSIFVHNDTKAIEWFNKAIVVAKSTQDNLNLARNYQYLGLIAHYQKASNTDELLSKAIGYAKLSKDWEVLATTYDIMSTHCLEQKRLKEAEIACYNAMITSEKYSPDHWLSYGLDYMDLLDTQNRQDEAFAFSQRFSEVRDKLKKSKGDFVYQMDLGRLETRLKHYVLADSIFQNALALEKNKTPVNAFRITHILRLALYLSVVEGNPTKAIMITEELSDRLVETKEQRLTQDSRFKMSELKSALELEQKEAEITLLADKQKEQRYFMLAAMGIALLLAGFLFILQRNKRRIEQQKIELVALNTTKDKLFAILSHDLMSPVATLKNSTMLVDWGEMSQTEFVELNRHLKTDIDNLYNMLENVLYWSITQMQGMKSKFEKVKFVDVVNEQIAFIEPTAKEKGIQIVQNMSDATIDVDRHHLALIVRNLLQNALKFTDKGGKISFKSQNTEGVQKLVIQDTGIGMSADMRAQLFKIENNTNRKGTAAEAGTGLGLILTKELVELNGGTIDVTSEVGKGTTFSIVFQSK